MRVRSSRTHPYAVLVGSLVLVMGLTNIALATFTSTDDGAITSASDTHGHNHAQHGSPDGHLGAFDTGNIELIGRMRINQDKEGRASDVGVFGDHAYVGAFSDPKCQKGGVYVFDLSDPTSPKQVNFIRTGGSSYVGEGVQVIHIDTPAYEGDVLVMNNEICGPVQPSTVGGVTFVDVTDPKRHTYLAKGAGDFDPPRADGLAHASHSAFMWDAGDHAYAVIIDNEEAPDLDILDITDPRSPELIAEYDLNNDIPGIIDDVKGRSESFSHDMIVKEVDGRFYMLASYWDGGYVVLDVTNPKAPQLIGDTDFAAIDEELAESTDLEEVPEGNAHQAEFTADDTYFVGADEDFGPYGSVATADGASFDGASAGSDTPQLAPGDTISGQAVFVGRACNGDPIHAATSGEIAVAERGICTFTEKVTNIEAAGDPDAILIFNRTASDGCTNTTGMTVAGSTPTFGVIGRDVAFGWYNVPYNDATCVTGNGTQLAPIDLGATGPTLSFESYFDGWGYVRLFANQADDGKFPLLDTYAIPEAHDPAFASGFGDLSVHEVATSPTDPTLMYFAYYAGGFRVVRIAEEKLVEVGAFIAEGGNNFWGVQVWTPESGPYAGEELVLASDRDYGVYIFRYTDDGPR